MKVKITTIIMIVLFLSVMFGGLFHGSSVMNVTDEGSGCLFMSHGDSTCLMDAFEHLLSWENIFQTIMPVLMFLSAVVFVTVILAPHKRLLKNFLSKLKCRYKFVVRVPSFFKRFLQDVYAAGILNLKLFSNGTLRCID